MVWLADYLRSDQAQEPSRRRPLESRCAVAVVLLDVAGVGAAAFVSDWFVDGADAGDGAIGVPKAFAGLVIVAIAGNAVENTAGVVLALQGASRISPSRS